MLNDTTLSYVGEDAMYNSNLYVSKRGIVSYKQIVGIGKTLLVKRKASFEAKQAIYQ